MPTKERLEKMKKVASRRQQGILVLEDTRDPHNAAAVLRSADAFGFGMVYFIFENQKKFNPKKVGRDSSASANKWLDFEVFKTTEECFKKLKKDGYTTIGTVLNTSAKSVFKTKFNRGKIALVLGNEHAGLTKTAVELCDEYVYLPMQGFVQSLNLSVTAALCMQEATRQRANSKESFLISKKEQKNLVSKWIKM